MRMDLRITAIQFDTKVRSVCVLIRLCNQSRVCKVVFVSLKYPGCELRIHPNLIQKSDRRKERESPLVQPNPV